ncbi:response regulator [Sulfurimonas sp. SAG-AH-194-C21]|nr:ATP-binding protein [Sulfurimonas sp. SAG-AH-194-C21]MDF1882869.1 response regulator [Sulfurimonas sp. SAG-AH-194-C21]
MAYIQYSYSLKIQKLYEAQLALKELQVKHKEMSLAQTQYFLTHKEKYVTDVEVYANTIDVYLEIVDDYLEEFTYSTVLENEMNMYLDTFLKIVASHKHKDNILLKKLYAHTDKINGYIEKEKNRLVPIVSSKIESAIHVQNSIYIFMLVIVMLLLIILLRPVVTSISLFKSFFTHHTDANERLDLEKLYFNEVQDIAILVNSMLQDQEKVQKELVESRDEALNLQKVKDEFLSNMSHELRTPLNAIGGFAGVLLRKLPEEKIVIEPIVDSAQHLLQLVGDILDLSKIQSGKFQIAPELFMLDDELVHFSHGFEPLMQKKNIDFIFTYTGEQDLQFYADWFRISQILNNFISNALKFTAENGRIEFNVSFKDNKLYMAIKDSGIGIKEEALELILKPFEQSDSGIARNFGGTGLGLTIAKTLTDMMHGTFNIESIYGKGSTFSIALPLSCVVYEKTDVQLERAEDENDVFFKGTHVLIVEDNKTNQLLLEMLLDDLEISADIANDGQEALDIFEEHKYAMILMDENMPNMGGVESMLALRKTYKELPPIIAVTANAMKGDRERLMDVGMDDFLSKPIDNNIFVTLLKKYLKINNS